MHVIWARNNCLLVFPSGDKTVRVKVVFVARVTLKNCRQRQSQQSEAAADVAGRLNIAELHAYMVLYTYDRNVK